jgi:hypothetical protein
MRTSIDILRSLKRYTAEALGDDWEVRLLSEEGTFSRPGAQVMEAGGQATTGPSHTMEHTQSFSIHAFPEPGGTVTQSMIFAAEAEEQLLIAFRVGVGEGRAARLPIYDYTSVPHDAGSTTRGHADYARILDLEIRREQSPSDELLFSVAVEVRLGWRRNAALTSQGRVLQTINTTVEGT